MDQTPVLDSGLAPATTSPVARSWQAIETSVPGTRSRASPDRHDTRRSFVGRLWWHQHLSIFQGTRRPSPARAPVLLSISSVGSIHAVARSRDMTPVARLWAGPSEHRHPSLVHKTQRPSLARGPALPKIDRVASIDPRRSFRGFDARRTLVGQQSPPRHQSLVCGPASVASAPDARS